jgi:methylated-DNA-[protein]-cysteine S-methyltransferase
MSAYTMIDSPIGELLLTGEPDAAAPGGLALTSVRFADQPDARPAGDRDDTAFAYAAEQVRAYFAGTRTEFEPTLAPRGTAFQERVWAALDAIPYGTTTTYGALAEWVGAPRDRIRAVAAAVGANPLLIIRPCHRVIGASGSLTGYAGGVARKEALLVHEGALQPQLA